MNKNGVKRASNLVNAFLYSTESITSILFSVFSIALIARHFGPEVMARFSVAQSVSTIFIVFATLGFDQFIIRELARNKRDAEYLSSILFGMAMGWLLYVALVVVYYFVIGEFSRDLFLIVSIVVSTLLLKVIFIKSYLQAQNKPKPIAIAALVSRFIAIIYLLIGTYINFSFEVMMLYMPLQAFVFILLMTISQPDFFLLIKPRHFNSRRLFSSMREAAPIFLSTMLYLLYSQSHILIMSNLLEPATVGIYSAAIQLIPQAAFIGFILVATFYTELDRKLLTDKTDFRAYVRSLLSMQFSVGIIMAIGVFLTADLIINLLYGARYVEGARVLEIACWAWIFILPAALYSRILIMLGYARYELIKMLIVAPLIILLNYWVISRVGMLGSAVVFVFSYFLVDFLIYFLFKDTRYLGVIGLKALADIFTKPVQTFRTSIRLMKTRN